MDNKRGIIKPTQNALTIKKGKNYFLGIGINDYTGGLAILHNAVRDVERVGQLLKEKYDFEIIQILTNAQATRSEILKQLLALQFLSKDDSLLIYYSGHGYLAPEDGYWIPVNANIEDIDHYIPNAQLRGLIRAIPTQHTLLIADSCYSGSFFPESESEIMRGVAAAELEKYRSRWAFCSGRHDQKVSDGIPGTHSPFADALITELERNTRLKVYIQELAIPVINRTAGKNRQIPKVNLIFDSGDNGGQFVFTLKNNNEVLIPINEEENKNFSKGVLTEEDIANMKLSSIDLIKKSATGLIKNKSTNGYLTLSSVDYPILTIGNLREIDIRMIEEIVKYDVSWNNCGVVIFWGILCLLAHLLFLSRQYPYHSLIVFLAGIVILSQMERYVNKNRSHIMENLKKEIISKNKLIILLSKITGKHIEKKDSSDTYYLDLDYNIHLIVSEDIYDELPINYVVRLNCIENYPFYSSTSKEVAFHDYRIISSDFLNETRSCKNVISKEAKNVIMSLH